MDSESQSSETNADGPNADNIKIAEDDNPLEDRDDVQGDKGASKLCFHKALLFGRGATSQIGKDDEHEGKNLNSLEPHLCVKH